MTMKLKPALEAWVKGIHVVTEDRAVVLSVQDGSERLDGDDIKALTGVLNVADHLVMNGY